MEFTLVAIPLIFLLISIVELSRGMWVYGTLAHAVKEGTRFAAVHGQGCAQASASCPVTLGAVAAVVRNAAVGLDPGQINVVLSAGGATQTCAPLSSCLSGPGTWPPAPNNGIGLPVKISGNYPLPLSFVHVLARHCACTIRGAKSRCGVAGRYRFLEFSDW